MTKETLIAQLNIELKNCHQCEGLNLDKNDLPQGETERTLNAPGYGNLDSSMMLIGQSLCGEPCMESQIPFTGGCGILLDKIFKEAGIEKKDIYTTNIVKCHPPKNRSSTKSNIERCSPYLVREIEIIRPKIIVCLGRDAGEYFGFDTALSKEPQAEKDIKINNRKIKVYRIYHPQGVIYKSKLIPEYKTWLAKIIRNTVGNDEI